MPFQPHYRVTALGRLSDSPERFSYSLNMAPNGGAGAAGGVQDTATYNTDAWADVADDVRAFHARLDSQISGRAVLTEVKVARIGADGKYAAPALLFDVADTPGGGGLNAFVVPQSALAISLATARRGATGRGRFYTPMPTIALDGASLVILAGPSQQTRSSAVQLINDMNNAPGLDAVDIKVCVASSKGYNSPVTGVRVGQVIDTIRSRRRSLLETYSATEVVA